ncbi:MAG: sugar transferase [Bacteroidetes bacterium]|uniref:Sugar transferase n=1 Tax=Candidatus Pullibacteroides excrementavium TaxID=2840905 RepID=A0A9D9DSR0_9BACT|nr:sugar transferase [Candidatus Pullibacteroides excrementavium]
MRKVVKNICIGKTAEADEFVSRLVRLRGSGNVKHLDWGESVTGLGHCMEEWNGSGEMEMHVYLFPERKEPALRQIRAICCKCLCFKSCVIYLWDSGESRPPSVFWMEDFLANEEECRFYRFPFARPNIWQIGLKRTFDIVFCFLSLVLLSPVFLLCALLIKLDSAGPVFYSQLRIGLKGKAFRIYKFRSMRVGAEQGKPELSNEEDPRITAWGRIMRRYRIDELPQLWNVIKGDMSLIGYRPERDYFIEKIEQVFPLYSLLYGIRPGITSQGMVNYGYAENVDEMLERLGEDMDYLRKLTVKPIRQDLKVMLKTVQVVFRGLGK